MLNHISVGITKREHALVVTPEFFEEAERLANKTMGVSIRLRFYPYMRNCVVLRGVGGPPPETRSFELGCVSIFIPKAQLALFEGRVLGYEMYLPGLPLLGFLDG